MKSLFSILKKAVLAIAGGASLCILCAEPVDTVTSSEAWLLKLGSIVIFALVLRAVEVNAVREDS